MQADLYSAQVHIAGDSGLAHRTAAGFVVVTSDDGYSAIDTIASKQADPDLIDQVVAQAKADGPKALAMLFTAGGDLFLLAAGSIAATVLSPSAGLSIQANPNEVLVHPISVGINESDAQIRIHVDSANIEMSDAAPTELQAGTMPASYVEIAVGDIGALAATQEAHQLINAPFVSTQPAPPAAEDIVFAEDLQQSADVIDARVSAPPVAQPVGAGAVPQRFEAVAVVPEPTATFEPSIPPATPRGPGAPGAPHGQVMVLGVACPQGHHNHPDAVYCSQCGTKMGVHQTTVLINGPRPPLGVLVVDDGTTYSLNQDLLIGREPTSHTDVKAGVATAMVLTDDSLSLSRQHARIVLDDWAVFVADLNSSNGTWVRRDPTSEQWTQVPAGTQVALEPGDQVRVGGRLIQVELHHVR